MRALLSLPLRFLCLFLGLLALPALAADKPTVAVLYFGYGGKTSELEVLKKGLAQMLITDLSGFGTVKLVERDRLQEIMDELELGQSNKIDQSTAVKIGRLLSARYLVMGGYFDLFNNLQLDAKVIEVETGYVIRSLGARGRPDEFFTLEQKLVQDIQQVLKELVSPSPEPSGSPGEPQPSRLARRLTTKTALRYSRALDAKDRKDVETAKKELKAVLEEQPDFTLASMDLARLMK